MEHIRLRLCKISIIVMTIFVIAFLKGCGKTQDNLIAADNNQNNENEVNYEGEWYRTDVPSYEWAKITISNWLEGESFDVTLLANYADYGGPVEGTAVFISEDTAVVYDENVKEFLGDSESDAGVYLQFVDGEIIVTHSEAVRLWFGGDGFATAEGRYIKGEPEYTNCTDVSTIFSEAELEEIEKLLGDDYETMFEWVVEMGEIEVCSLPEGTLWKAYYPPYGAVWCNILINNDGSIYMEGSYWGTDYWFHSNDDSMNSKDAMRQFMDQYTLEEIHQLDGIGEAEVTTDS